MLITARPVVVGRLMKLTVTGYFHGSLARFDFFDADNGEATVTDGLAPPRRRGGRPAGRARSP